MNGEAAEALEIHVDKPRTRFGLKGPRAAEWLAGHGIGVPAAPNTWSESAAEPPEAALFVARLGAAEFFLEDAAGAERLCAIAPVAEAHPPGVYPVLRQDAAFSLSGGAVHDVLAQVCNIDFKDLDLAPRPIVMTSMIGVSVLVQPREVAGARRYRIWCDPTFAAYFGASLGAVVIECGGHYRGVSA
jgi:sarcosine oxidase subunit gamma